MLDLNTTMFYKAKFTIISQNESEDLLWKLVCVIRNWLTRKHNKKGEIIVIPDIRKWTYFKTGGKLFDEKNSGSFFAKSIYHVAKDNPNAISWACKIEEKPEATSRCAPREWITEIGYQSTTPGTAEISYVVRYGDAAGFLGELAPAPGISLPSVIWNFLDKKDYICKVGNTKLSAHPFLLNAGDYPEFEKLLFDADRAIPIIYISPKRDPNNPDQWITLVNPEKLAESVAANAVVYYSEDGDFSSEMRNMGDDRYTCSGGAIRVYQPLIDKDSPNDRYRHRIIFPDYIETHEEPAILELFRRAFAQDVYFYETMFRMDSCQNLIDYDKHQERINQITDKKDIEFEELFNEYLAESEKKDLSDRKLKESEEEANRLKKTIIGLELQVDANQEKADRLDAALYANNRIRSVSQHPSSPEQIVQYFEIVFADRIVFTEKAHKSLKDCITKPEILWDALYHMATDLYDCYHDHPAQALQTFKDKTGWDYGRGLGKQSHADPKIMENYTDSYNGHEINIEPHLKRGVKDSDPKSIRIYFAYDRKVADKIIVGHCGKHLVNATTLKIK